MKKRNSFLFAVCFLMLGLTRLHAQPAGFVDVSYMDGFDQSVGMTFDANGRMYVWEKNGKVWIIQNGVKQPSPLINISDEVGNWRDFGLVGFALDPDFLTNGYIYLYYVVDRHHLLYHGTAAYNPSADEYFNATIARVTRYTAQSATGYTTVDYNSRQILLGESRSTGIPVLYLSHGAGTMEFAKDGTLILSTGDGASFAGPDLGGNVHGSYAPQALIDGIIAPYEDYGSYRSLLLNSHSGKILRINPISGDGLPSNPFYDPANPRSAKSRVWATGFRNPFRMTIVPGSGSHYATDGNPGVLIVGDVGNGLWEEMNICTRKGQNFGWPLFEGMDPYGTFTNANVYNLDAPTPSGCVQPYYYFRDLLKDSVANAFPDVCNPGQQINPATTPIAYHSKGTYDWLHGTSGYSRVRVGDNVYNMGAGSPVPGNSFYGNASVAGLYYTGTDFPEGYRNVYFHADFVARWIRAFRFESNMAPDSVKDFIAGGYEQVVDMAAHPSIPGFFYIAYPNVIHRVYYTGTLNQPPVAVASASSYYTPGNSLTVNFTGSNSTDPENATLIYNWNFGDGNTSTQANPVKTYNATPGVPTQFQVTLTVTDPEGLSSTKNLIISLNNTPPVIQSTSLAGVTEYSITAPTTLPLSAVVTDAEHGPAQLTYSWYATLHHDVHTHPEPADNNPVSSVVLSPIGCDGVLYFYRVTLIVQDAAGLADTVSKDIYPHCIPLVEPDDASFSRGGTHEIAILANDYSEDGFNYNSLQITNAPNNGTATYSPVTKKITYIHNGSATSKDTLSYRIQDLDGEYSQPTNVYLTWYGPPKLTITSPTDGSTIDNTAIKFFYLLTGDIALADRMQFILDNGTPVDITSYTGIYTTYAVPTGNRQVRMQLVNAAGNVLTEFPASRDTVNFTSKKVGARMKLRTGTVTASNAWQTITLDTTYTQMVVVATPVLSSGSQIPVVTRIRNVNATSFQVRVQNPSDAPVSGYKIYYLTMEAGTYTLALDGIKAEAKRVTSNQTASISAWPLELRTYSNTYSNPVVLGQVMTQNDPDWSVFWCSYEQGRYYPPNATEFAAGKLVGTDPDVTRSNETLGMIIFEGGTGIIRGRPYTAWVGDNTVQGIGNVPSGSTYGTFGINTPVTGVLSSAGQDGPEGSWPVFVGNTPFNGPVVTLAIDEDTYAEPYRDHSNERVAYFLMEEVTSPPTGFPVEWLDFEAKLVGEKVSLLWSTASETNNDHFTVERSRDGAIFQGLFDVPSQGNSNEPQSYQAWDDAPASGVSYYRIRQTDFDGAINFSGIVEVRLRKQEFIFYPSPVAQGQNASLELYMRAGESLTLRVCNMLGQTVVEQELDLPSDNYRMSLPTQKLPAGNYVLFIEGEGQRWQHTFQVQSQK